MNNQKISCKVCAFCEKELWYYEKYCKIEITIPYENKVITDAEICFDCLDENLIAKIEELQNMIIRKGLNLQITDTFKNILGE